MKVCLMKNKYNITFLLDHLNYGGVEICYISLANQMAKLGHNVKIVTIINDQPLKNKVEQNVKLETLNATRVAGSLFKIIKLFRQNNADIVISGKEYVNIFATLAHKLSFTKTRHLAVIHTDLEQEFKNNNYSKIKIIKFLSKIAYKHADLLAGVSKTIANRTKQFCNTKRSINTLYNPVNINVEFNSNLTEVTDLKKQGKKVVVTCGRLSAAKNHTMLLNSFASALLKDDSLHLIIIGNGELKEQVELEIKILKLEKNVTLKSSVDNVLDYFASSDLFILPSLYEGFGLVLVEALVAKTPVLVSAIDVFKEILNNGKSGQFIKDINADFSEDILKALKLNKKEDFSDIIKQFSAENSAKNYLDLIKRIKYDK